MREIQRRLASNTPQLISHLREIQVPMFRTTQLKDGVKTEVEKVKAPGYVFLRGNVKELFTLVKRTDGVTGWVGGDNPLPMSEREMAQLLDRQKSEDTLRQSGPSFQVGSLVRVVQGPMADFEGRVVAVDEPHAKLTIEVAIFGRNTPVSLGFSQVTPSRSSEAAG